MTLIVAPLHEVETVLRRRRPSHVISLSSPGAETANIPAGIARLSLTFHDIVEPTEGLQPATSDQVARLLDFAAAWPRVDPLLIHCWAGVSRSPAAAYAVACLIAGPSTSGDLARRLRVAAPFATPNRRVIALADAALGRGGSMSAAIASIGRGAETSMGATFDLTPEG
jgi:predicted protein tyrosine phosphatase